MITMKTTLHFLFLALLAAGCATSNINSRKLERSPAYAALTPEQRALVDRGEIKVGLTMDAVYVAWGQPSQIMASESGAGATTTWIYSGTVWREQRYWAYQSYGGRYGHVYPTATLNYDYVPMPYTSAEVVFENGVVKSWRNITPPQSY